MKKLSLIFVFALTGCAIIYGNKSFLYKSADDYRTMTVADVEQIVANGGDLNVKNSLGRYPISMACIYSPSADVITSMIENGAKPYNCSLYDFLLNKNASFVSKQALIQNLLTLGVKPTSLEQEVILNQGLYNPKKFIELLKKYKISPSEYVIKKEILASPLDYKTHIKNYGKDIGKENILVWIISSPSFSKKYRNSKQWYELVDYIKASKARGGIIGMSKSEYVTKYGIPDQEYKINNNTIVLTYVKELRNNVPLSASSYSKSFYFDTMDTVYTQGTTYTSGGYTNVNRWKENVYVDKGIVTGVENQDQVITY